MNFSQPTEDAIKALMSHYPERRGALIPSLYLVQKELGYLPEPAQMRVAELLQIAPAQVKEVVTFYPMLHDKPQGKHPISVCRTLSCAMRGGRTLVKKLEKHLDIHCGESTKDGLFSLDTAECLGSCGTAPMMMIGDKYYENLDWVLVLKILEDLKNQTLAQKVGNEK